MRIDLCVCAEVPKLQTNVRLCLLIHSLELKSTTNTGRLAASTFPDHEIRVRGKQGSPMNAAGLVNPSRESLFLFPSEDAVELTKDYVESIQKPITLIVPDGTWRQASKVSRRVKELQGVQRIKLPKGKPSEYFLRVAPSAESLSTIEAIARVMGIVEGEDSQNKLEKLFRLVVQRTLWSRGALKLSDCQEFL